MQTGSLKHIPCKYFPKCFYGDSCLYSHSFAPPVVAPVLIPVAPQNGPLIPCKYWPKCPYGDKCFFFHDPALSTQKSSVSSPIKPAVAPLPPSSPPQPTLREKMEIFVKEFMTTMSDAKDTDIQQKITAQKWTKKETTEFFDILNSKCTNITFYRHVLQLIIKEWELSESASLLSQVTKGDVPRLVSLLGVGRWGGTETIYGFGESSFDKTARLIENTRKLEKWNVEKGSSFMVTLAKDWVVVHSEPQFSFLISIVSSDWDQPQTIEFIKSISEKQNWQNNVEDSIMFFRNFSTHCKTNLRDIQKIWEGVCKTWEEKSKKVMSSWLFPAKEAKGALVLCGCGTELNMPRDWSLIDTTYGLHSLQNHQLFKEHLHSAVHKSKFSSITTSPTKLVQ